MKKILTLTLILVLMITSALPAFAAETDHGYTSEYSSEEVIPARAEQTVWYTTVMDGVPMKRLWSITYGYWKTDWIPA